MAQFTADIAGMLELFAIAAGLVLLHRASKEAPAKLLKAAGWVLVAGGIVVGACTTIYWFKYQARGEFDTVHMGYPGMMNAREAAMGTGTMGTGTMGTGSMGTGTMGTGTMGPGMTGPGMGSTLHGVTPPPSPADGAR